MTASTELVLGLAGIIGTFVGALSATGVTYYSERKKQQRAEQTARDDAKRAARLVWTELREARAAVETTLSEGTSWSDDDAPSRDTWIDYRPLLAASLETGEYRQVTLAYVHLKRLLAVAKTWNGGKPPDAYREVLEVASARLEEGAKALDRLAEPEKTFGVTAR